MEALLKDELNPEKPIDQFSYWVSIPNDKYIVNGCRSGGYQFLAVGGTKNDPVYTCNLQYGLNLNYNRYISEKTSNEDLLVYATRSGLVWIDLSSKERVPAPVVHKNIKNKLTEGATLYKNNTFLLTRERTLSTVLPGGDSIDEISAPDKHLFNGIPRWDGGNNILVSNFVKRCVTKVDTESLTTPSIIFNEQTIGYPEPGVFWEGKWVVPCGYQGLLIEK